MILVYYERNHILVTRSAEMLAAIFMPIWAEEVFYEIKSSAVGRDAQVYPDRNGPHPLLQATGQNASKRDQAADAE